MSSNKNSILAVAVIGALYAAGASAQFNITTGGTSLAYAQELTKPATILESAGNRLAFNLGYNFSDNEVRYARVECSSNLTFITPEVEAVANAAAVVGSLNNSGNAVFFSVTDPVSGGSTAVANTTLVIGTVGAGDIYTIGDNNPVTCSYSLYDQPSQAQAGGAAGRIVNLAARTFITAAPSYTFTATPGTATVDVEAANGAYTNFLGADRSIGSFAFALVANAPLNAAGAAISLANIFEANTAVRINGDMTGFTAASGRDVGDTCAATNAFTTFSAANGVGSSTIGSTATTNFICFTANGSIAIPAGDYTATLIPRANNGYTVANSAALAIGSIVRNGTQIQAPLVQIPSGYISRIALTNTGTAARTFTWTFRPATGGSASETSSTFTGTASGTGTIPANGSAVVSLVDALGLANFGGTPPRGFFTVNVAAPNNQIQGLYQIVNPATGAISNHVMVRPGSN